MQVALVENVHTDQGIKHRTRLKLESLDVVEDEWKGRLIAGNSKTHPKHEAFGLAFALNRADWSLATTRELKSFCYLPGQSCRR